MEWTETAREIRDVEREVETRARRGGAAEKLKFSQRIRNNCVIEAMLKEKIVISEAIYIDTNTDVVKTHMHHPTILNWRRMFHYQGRYG